MGLGPKLSRAIVLLNLLCLLAPPPPVSAKLKTFTIEYPSVKKDFHYKTVFEAVPNVTATITDTAFQVTPDTGNTGYTQTYQAGRVMYKFPFKLWEGRNDTYTDRVASFNTSFLVNLNRVKNSTAAPGEGLTFVVAPDLNIPQNSFGEYLGLTNSTTDTNSTNQFIAVELDTFKQDFDPDSNHVGLNINTVRSYNTTSLTQFGFELVSPDSENFFNVWVQYDGIKKVIEVYIAQQANQTDPTPPRPANPILTSNLDLRGVVNQYSYFGFSASTSNAIELNCVLRWNLTVEYYNDDKQLLLKIGLGVGIPTVVILAAAAVLAYYLRKRALSRSNTNILGALKSLPGTPREFEFKDLKKATNSFDQKKKLGQGGYGVVYRGHLANEDLEVAVKMFSREALKGEDDFLAELTIINRLRHKNLVPLLGWCHKNGKLLLVYDYMPNGSLDKHLFGELANSNPLGWSVRQKIISGVAFALHYLHVEYDQRVVHRDLKASNIMLDTDFTAKLGDFGLARALDNSKTSYIEPNGGVKGTAGYIAPECFLTHKATEQSDVYAFGAVLLEVVCGLRPGTQIGEFDILVDWVWSLHREGRLLEAVDKRPMEDYVAEEAQRILLLGLACSHPKASDRPKIQEIVQILSGSIPGPLVPPFKPRLGWLSVPEGEEDVSNATTTETRSVTISH